MKISEGFEHFYNYQRLNMKKKYVAELWIHPGQFPKPFRRHRAIVHRIRRHLDIYVRTIRRNQTEHKEIKVTLLSAFFNFIKNSVNPKLLNPCNSPALRKLFKAGKPTQFDILEKDMVDEIIFRTRNPRNRLMLELMARSCLRVGEVRWNWHLMIFLTGNWS